MPALDVRPSTTRKTRGNESGVVFKLVFCTKFVSMKPNPFPPESMNAHVFLVGLSVIKEQARTRAFNLFGLKVEEITRSDSEYKFGRLQL